MCEVRCFHQPIIHIIMITFSHVCIWNQEEATDSYMQVRIVWVKTKKLIINTTLSSEFNLYSIKMNIFAYMKIKCKLINC